MKSLLLSLFVVSSLCAQAPEERKPISTDQVAIEITGASREILLANRRGNYLLTESSGEHHSARQGWYVDGRKVMDDYLIDYDNRPLRRSEVVRTVVSPQQFVREYRNGLREIVTMLDNVDIVTVELDNAAKKYFRIRPYFKDVRDTSEMLTGLRFGELIFGRKSHQVPTPADSSPGWLGMMVVPGTSFAFGYLEADSGSMGFSPASLAGAVLDNEYAAIFVTATLSKKIFNLGANNIKTFLDSVYEKRVRIDQLYKKSYLRTDDTGSFRAIQWAKTVLDQCMPQGGMPGLLGGFPESRPDRTGTLLRTLGGAYLPAGYLTETALILETLAACQDTNPASPTFGRFPGSIFHKPFRYDEAETAPAFCEAACRYLNVTGDTAFAHRIFPAIRRSVDGTLRYHCDSLGFLLHDGDETWMKIRRGNRANDMQMAWKSQLESAIAIASLAGPQAEPAFVGRWKTTLADLQTNFLKSFVDTVSFRIADNLSAGGVRDMRIRPGTFSASGLVSDPLLARKINLVATSALAYPYGIGTLAADDSGFVPFRYLAGYPSVRSGEWNGPIYPALTAAWCLPVIRMGLADTAYRLLRFQEDLLVNGPCPGNFPEHLDLLPKQLSAFPECSGNVTSLASASAYLQTWYEGFLGASVDRWGTHLTLRPNLPSAVHYVDFNQPIGRSVVRVVYRSMKDEFRIDMETPPDARPVDWTVAAPVNFNGNSTVLREASVQLMPGSKVTVHITAGGFSLSDSAQTRPLEVRTEKSGLSPDELSLFRFASAPTGFDPSQLKQSSVPYMTIEELKGVPANAVTFCDIADSSGDENSPTPDVAGLVEGSLDMRHLTVKADAGNVYFTIRFRDISYPFANPECGFDHTILAIAIDKSKKGGRGETVIGKTAAYTLKNFTADNFIYVGRGLTVQDGKGKPLAMYEPQPADESSPLGSFADRTISFSLPIPLIGLPEKSWRFAVMTGVNDGGEGPGLFRAKGSPDAKNGNVYDIVRSGNAR
jgi:hypothetical protein